MLREIAQLIFKSISDQLEDLTKPKCIMCNESSCNGFKVNDKFMCKKRIELVTTKNNMVCYGCGGPHPRSECSFRPKGGRPQVPSNIGRCFLCYLPQHVQSGCSFHSGETGLSGGGSQSQNTICTQRGDQVFALLSAFYWSRNTIHELFMTCQWNQVGEVPPHHTEIIPAGG